MKQKECKKEQNEFDLNDQSSSMYMWQLSWGVEARNGLHVKDGLRGGSTKELISHD